MNKITIIGHNIQIEKEEFNFNRKDSERYGCDCCKKDKSTEKFEGFKGGILWICGECYRNLRTKKPSHKTKTVEE